MPRATISDVSSILPTSTQLTDSQIQASIDAATCVVDQIALGCAAHLTDACLTQVEIYLSAHYAAVTENTLTLTSENSDCADSSVTYGFKFGEGVMGTPFGQMANTLSSGCLKNQDKTPAAMFSIGCL